MASVYRLATVFGLIGCFYHGVCQDNVLDSPPRNSSDPTSFERFFQQVTHLKNVSGPVLLNGQPSQLTQPTPQNAIGLTDEESQVLNAIASDCEAKIRSLDASVRSSIFEARLQRIESEDVPLAVRQLKNYRDERAQIVLTHIQQLRVTLGDSRFKMLDTYVRSNVNSFFPPVPAGRL